ncbi:hypothetical protein F383_38796 [Gossypium arboreum]|uniref:Uncharacterized protein n=1 Tax=Gossypium arboreum TaxID=29729 RepID=A0A0B0MI19_GOSAR|nr:hypothetical protein F383_38796 [Gossypium arboreum]
MFSIEVFKYYKLKCLVARN